MKQVLKGTTVTRDETIDGRVVTKDVSTLNAASDANYLDTWTFDYTNVSEDELLVLATRSLVIEAQGKFRRAKSDKLSKFDRLSVNVREYLDNKRKKSTPEQRKAKAIDAVKAAGVSKADLEAMIAAMDEAEEESDES